MKLCKQCRKPECPNGDFDEGMEMAASMFRTGLDASIEEFKRQQDVDSLSRVSASIASARATCVSLLALVDAVESKIGTRPCPPIEKVDVIQEPLKFPLVIVVNGQPVTVQVHVGMALSQVAQIALAQVGSVGRPLEHWYCRDDDGVEVGMDFVIAKPFEPGAKLWLYLGRGMVDAGKGSG